MRTLISVLLAAAVSAGQQLPITGLAHAGFLVSDLDKARQFYSGILGYEEAFDLKNEQGQVLLTYFKINDDQFIEVFPGLAPNQDVRMTHVALRTSDIEKLHKMLDARGLAPGKISAGRDGNLNFSVKDPGGMRLEFVEYRPGSLHWKARGKFLSSRRISGHLQHAGVTVANLDAALAFYRDKLGFQETWRGGPSDQDLRYVNMRMPGPGGDYIEFMLHSTPPTRSQLGSMLHICLEVPDIQAAYKKAVEHGLPPEDRFQPRVGLSKRWLMSTFDPDGSRTEFMEPKRVE